CIFLSAHAEFTYAQEAVRLGGFDYILQPAPYSEIEEAVARALQDIKEKEPAEMPQPAETAGGTPAYTGSSSPVASAIDYIRKHSAPAISRAAISVLIFSKPRNLSQLYKN